MTFIPDTFPLPGRCHPKVNLSNRARTIYRDSGFLRSAVPGPVRSRWGGGGTGASQLPGGDLSQKLEDAAAEQRERERLGAAACQDGIVRMPLGFPGLDRGPERGNGRLVIEAPDRVVHRLRGASPSQGDHGGAAGQGLDRDDPEVFLTGEKQGPAAAIVIADDLVGLPAQELDRRSRRRPPAASARAPRR